MIQKVSAQRHSQPTRMALTRGMLQKRALPQYPPYALAALAVAALLTLSACSGFTSKVSRRFGGKVNFDVELDSRLNQDFPLAVDLVIVYDKALYAELQKMASTEWFEKRDQYKLDGEPSKLEVSSWEWVPPPDCDSCPGPESRTVDYRIGAHGGVLFADYFNPGVHRIVIEPLKAFTLKLGEKSAELAPPRSKQESKAEKKKAKQAKKDEKKKKKSG